MNKDDLEGRRIAKRLREGMAQQPQPMGKAQLGIDPRHVGDLAAFSVAAALMKAGDLEAAEEIAVNLIGRYPGHPEAAYILALCAWWLRRDVEGAKTALTHVLAHRPTVPEYWYNLGFMLQRSGDDAGAAEVYERCLGLKPDFAGALVNLGNARLAQGRMTEALACFTKAAACAGETDALARYNRAMAHFFLGDWTKGWEDFEYRWGNPEFLAKAVRPPLPFWTGDAPNGRRLLVFAEQGIGDMIMCARYKELLWVQWAGRVEWVVQPALAGLLNATPMRGEWPEADVCLPAMSCMHRLGMPVASRAYLLGKADFAPPPDTPPRIGYVWAGSPDYENDRRRSIDRALWDGLLSTSGVEWVDLQVGRGGTYAPKDWQETAQLVGSLDLVITVDTAVAHLAGAMGVPVWILLPSYPDYRWGLNTDTTVWYESARLFRQERDGDWQGVLTRVEAALTQWRDA